jgi:hypothetical protein
MLEAVMENYVAPMWISFVAAVRTIIAYATIVPGPLIPRVEADF